MSEKLSDEGFGKPIIVLDDPATQKLGVLYAYMAEDMNGNYGIVAEVVPPMPLVFTDPKLIERFRPVVDVVAKRTGRVIKLVRFGEPQVLESIT